MRKNFKKTGNGTMFFNTILSNLEVFKSFEEKIWRKRKNKKINQAKL